MAMPVPRLRKGAAKAIKRSDAARAKKRRVQRARAERKAKYWKRIVEPA
jgi:hypothetical protein